MFKIDLTDGLQSIVYICQISPLGQCIHIDHLPIGTAVAYLQVGYWCVIGILTSSISGNGLRIKEDS